ncbi:MAG TPA: type IV-A pilus assembly ATPase PilB, partial [Stenotrophomonas sp.]|nr:type IV-A pilus assembly ATPase PilB [Stenotrophomonas sp.]
VVEPILVDEEQIKRTLEQWQSKHDTLGSALGGGDDDMGDLDVSSGDEEGGSPDAGVDAKGDDTPVVKF